MGWLGTRLTPGLSLAYHANARAQKLATPPRVVAVERVLLSILTPTRARGVSRHFWARLNVVENHWITSGASPCVKRRKLTAGKPE